MVISSDTYHRGDVVVLAVKLLDVPCRTPELRLDRMDARFDEIDAHFDDVYKRFERLESKYQFIKAGLPRRRERKACLGADAAGRQRLKAV